MFFGILGTLLVEAGGPAGEPGPVSIAGAKERALLGRLLVSAGRGVPVDVLADDLWDGAPPPTARKSLQAHVVRLRSALEPERPAGSPGRFVVRRGDGYAFGAAPETVDASRLKAAAAAGRAALSGGDPERSRSVLSEAELLWRGTPLADWPGADWARGERERLIDVHASVVEARIDADLALGRHREAVSELEALVVDQPLYEGWWTRLMLSLYRSDRQSDALVAARRARAVLVEERGLDAGPALRQMERAILRQDPSLEPAISTGGIAAGFAAAADRTSARQVSATCPYRGLAAYDVRDAALFRGRGGVVRDLVARVRKRALVVVSGPSGAGKSSLVRAGLLPALATGADPERRRWQAVTITPGAAPVDRLAPLLSAPPSPEPGGPAGLLLVVDQFEELWTAGCGEDERAAFMDELVAMLDSGPVARAVLVCRGDHLGRLADHAELAARASAGMLLVPPMTEAELREVVLEPAAVAGLEVDPDLVEAVIRDVHGQNAVLPLLSSALVSTWERRQAGRLTLTGYLEAGGVTGALAQAAEDALHALEPGERESARALSVRLAAVGEGGGVVRRRVPLDELGLTGPDGPARRRVIEAFVSRRLLTVDRDRLEVTHEALFVAWPRLRGWLAEDAIGRVVRSHLAPEARDWDAAGRPEDRLYRGARLEAAQEWLDRDDSDPTPAERDFVEAGARRSVAGLARARAVADRERAARRRTRRLAAVLAVSLILALGSGGLAVHRGRTAQATAVRADANRLAAAAANAPALDLSLLLAAQAYTISSTPDTEDALLVGLVGHRQITRVFRDRGQIRHIAISPDGKTLYAHAERRVVAWDLATGRRRVVVDDAPAAADAGPAEYPSDVDVSGSGEVAVVVPPAGDTDASRLALLEPDGTERWSLRDAVIGGWPMSVEFAADGSGLLVEAMADHLGPAPAMLTRRVDPATGALGPILDRSPVSPSVSLDPWVSGLADGGAQSMTSHGATGVRETASGAGTRLDVEGRDVTGSWFVAVAGGVLESDVDGRLHWFPRGSTRASQTLGNHAGQVYGAATDATGTVLVTGGADRRLVVHDLVDHRWVLREVVTGQQGTIVEVAVSRDGRHAFAVSEDRTVVEIDLTDRTRFGTPVPRLRDRAEPEAHPLILGNAALAGTPPVWVLPVMSNHGDSENLGAPHWGVAAFIDPTTQRILSWTRIGDLSPGTVPLAAATVSPDRRLVAVTADRTTAVLDTRTRRVVARVVLPEVDGRAFGRSRPAPEPVTTAAWTPDGTALLLGTGDQVSWAGSAGAVVAVDTRTWTPGRRLFEGSSVYTLDVSPDGRRLAVGGTGGVVIADLPSFHVTARFPTRGATHAVRFSPDGRRLVAGGQGKRLDIWDVERGTTTLHSQQFEGAATSLQWLRDGRTVVYAGSNGRALLVDAGSGTRRAVPLPTFRDAGDGLTFLAPGDGRSVALLPGARSGDAVREGVVYPLEPRDWVRHACAVAGRQLTPDEWRTYLPSQSYRPTCPATS